MPSGEIAYTFRNSAPDVLQRARTQAVRLEAYRDGALVPPTSGTFTLIDPGGTALVAAAAITVVNEAAQYTVDAADIPETVSLSELYQQRWALVMPDGTTRTVRRECAIARFLFHPPVADVDLTTEYPDIIDSLGEADQTAQPFIDGATGKVLRKLFKSGQWPDIMLSSDAFYDAIYELTLYRIFKWLYRETATNGGTSRWERLMDIHKAEADKAWQGFTSRIDNDHDGLPDELGRQAASTVIHRNVAPYRTRRRTARW